MKKKTHKQLITPYLSIFDGAEKALEWYGKAFQVKIRGKPHLEPNSKKILHAVMELPNGGVVYVADHFPEFEPEQSSHGSSNICTHVHFKHGDGDAFWKHLMHHYKHDVKVFMDYDYQFWNDKYANFTDPFGQRWSISQPMTNDEMEHHKKSLENKKRTFEEAELDNDDNNNNHSKKVKLSNGFVEIRKMDHPEICLSITYKVGSKGTHTFSEACHDAYPKLTKLCQHHNINKSKAIAIAPEDPAKFNPCRYTVAYMFDSHKMKKEDLKKYETEEIKYEEIPVNDYYIYQHVGPYEGLPESWKNCIEEVKQKGYHISNDKSYEEYIDDCCKVKIDQCRTFICIPVNTN